MSNDELKRRLEAMAARQAPPVDGRFANRLEADLREVAAGRPSGFNLRSIFLRPAAIMAMAAVLIGVVFVVTREEAAPSLEFASAEGTSVSIPGQATETDAVAGLEIPEGSRIAVGADGSATVAGVVLEAGTIAVIEEGRLELVDAPSATATSIPDVDRSTTTAPTTTAPDRPVDPESTTTTTTTAAGSTDAPTPTVGTRPTTTTTVAVRPTDAPTTTTATPTTTAPTTTTTTATTKPPDQTPLAIHLEVTATDKRRVTLSWQPNRDDPQIAGWELRVRKGDKVRTLVVLRQPGARRVSVELEGRDVSYRIIARAIDGTPIARSAFVAPSDPNSVASGDSERPAVELGFNVAE